LVCPTTNASVTEAQYVLGVVDCGPGARERRTKMGWIGVGILAVLAVLLVTLLCHIITRG